MNMIRLSMRLPTRMVMVQQRYASTEVVKKPRKNAAKPKVEARTPKKLKIPSTGTNANARTIFMSHYAAQVRAAGGKFNLQEASKAFNALSEAEIAEHAAKVPARRAELGAVRDAFMSNLTVEQIEAENKRRSAMKKKIRAGEVQGRIQRYLRVPDAPKRPMTAFMLFCEEARPAVLETGTTGPDMAKILGERWREMPEEQKAKYFDQYKESRAGFAKL